MKIIEQNAVTSSEDITSCVNGEIQHLLVYVHVHDMLMRKFSIYYLLQ